jgi:hypothetical protein
MRRVFQSRLLNAGVARALMPLTRWMTYLETNLLVRIAPILSQ